jgi:hypothetical protein
MQQSNEQTENRWQKIGTQGEVLAKYAKKWAAVIDNETELMWAINPTKTANFPNPQRQITWNETTAWVIKANEERWCGFNDWRLPTIDELHTLLTKNQQPNMHIREDIFNDIPDEYYIVWSSSPVAAYSNGAWIVDFYYGLGSDHDVKNATHSARLVRSI